MVNGYAQSGIKPKITVVLVFTLLGKICIDLVTELCSLCSKLSLESKHKFFDRQPDSSSINANEVNP